MSDTKIKSPVKNIYHFERPEIQDANGVELPYDKLEQLCTTANLAAEYRERLESLVKHCEIVLKIDPTFTNVEKELLLSRQLLQNGGGE